MEDDSKSDVACKDIARQLIENEPGRSLNVIMGGGLRSFVGEDNENGRRKDGRNLTVEWLKTHPRGEFVVNRSQLMAIGAHTEHLLGIFASSHMHFNADRDEKVEPSLAEMTAMALEILRRRNTNGFLLVVEAGKIDLAHHYNNAFRALDDTLALDEAVRVAVRSVGKKFETNEGFNLSSRLLVFRSGRLTHHRHCRSRLGDGLLRLRDAKRLFGPRHGQIRVEC
jgi:alkaline phosphatase